LSGSTEAGDASAPRQRKGTASWRTSKGFFGGCLAVGALAVLSRWRAPQPVDIHSELPDSWQLTSCSPLEAQFEPGPQVHSRRVINAAEVAGVFAAEAAAKSGDTRMSFPRSFGYDQGTVKGHNVTFMHTVFPAMLPELLSRLRCLTIAADELQGWGVVSRVPRDMLSPRVIELITYDAGNSQGGGAANDANLGWHSDLGSLLTTGVTLSPPEDYDGGVFEVQPQPGSPSVSISGGLGDAVIWKSWDTHRVSPVTRGRRQVLVVEWWHGPPNRDPQALRGIRATRSSAVYQARSYQLAVDVDPANGVARLNMGTWLQGEERSVEALSSFREAIKLDPTSKMARSKLGRLLNKRGQTDEAVVAFRAGLALDPANAELALISAMVAVTAGDPEASTELTAAIQLAPARFETRKSAALTLTGLERETEAAHHLKVAMALSPGDKSLAELQTMLSLKATLGA